MANPVISPGETKKEVIRVKRLTISHLRKFGKDEMASAINPKSTFYGKEAVKGVRYVQRRFKLMVDGIVGPNTWKVLEYARRPRPPVPVLVVVPREQWGARPARGVDAVVWTKITPTRVHHTVTPQPKGSGKDLVNAEHAALREIQKYHMDSRKYVDIAYNFLIMPSGRVYEGRGKGVEGAHTVGHNSDCGIAFVGNYDNDTLTFAQVRAYKRLRRKLGLSGGPAFPHSATYSTSCPGKNIVTRLKLG